MQYIREAKSVWRQFWNKPYAPWIGVALLLTATAEIISKAAYLIVGGLNK